MTVSRLPATARSTCYHRHLIVRQHSGSRLGLLRPELYASYIKVLSYIAVLSYKRGTTKDVYIHVANLPPYYPLNPPRAILGAQGRIHSRH